LLGRECIKATLVSAVRYLRPWKITTSGFGMLFFGMVVSHNNINVLQRSLVFGRLTEGLVPAINYDINGRTYTKGYYLANDIYPSWVTFVKTISDPHMEKRAYFTSAKRVVGRMSSRHLVYFKVGLLLSGTPLLLALLLRCER
jgi:hypothetical protein